jgi:hypothetical protein
LCKGGNDGKGSGVKKTKNYEVKSYSPLNNEFKNGFQNTARQSGAK